MNMKYTLWSTLAAVCIVASHAAHAQEAPAFQNLRFEEDWSNFDKTQSDHWTSGLKMIQNPRISDSFWMSVGGEQRFRYENWDSFGFNELNDDGFLMMRTQLHADIHVNKTFRVFLEGRYTNLTDRDLPDGKRAPLDWDQGDIGNAFAEGVFDVGIYDVTARLGRQELQYGKQRLISPLDWANNRRLFDGGLVSVKSESGHKVDAFFTAPVDVLPDHGEFNDTSDYIRFYGVYYTGPLTEKMKMDAYLLVRDFRHEFGAEETRYTLGGRLYGSLTDRITYDAEVAYQWGDQDLTDLDISAWAVTLEGTYTFADTPWKPAITFGIDYATGDDDPTDDDINTFSQLFPLAHAYNGFADITARQNIIDYRVTVAASPIPDKLGVRGDIHFMQLESDDDGLYAVSGAPLRPAAGEDDLAVELDLTATYKFTKHQSGLIGYSHVEAGDYIEDTGTDDDIDFFYVQWGYEF